MPEAEIAISGGADILDLKDPSRGALGALASTTVSACVAGIARRRIVSATAGDLPMEPEAVTGAVRRLAALGVDIVKIGIFPEGDARACVAALTGDARRGTRLVAVMFADHAPDFSLLPRLRHSGFVGAMLDTAGKTSGGLRQHLTTDVLSDFVATTRELGLMSGLAGSLQVEDISPLAALSPDYLGFRGGICDSGRQSALNAERLCAVRSAIDRVNIHQRAARMATAAAGAQRAAHATA
jgi:uncharacterized protein (UPF0264 family)